MVGVTTSGFSQRYWRWLQQLGFKDDPFALYEADHERDYIPYFFVDRPYLHDILGDPAHPQSAFLFAHRGEGKSATREMVAYECRHGSLRRRALAVRHYDFRPLLENVDEDITQITIRHHVAALLRSVFKTLSDGDVPPLYFEQLDSTERALLMGLAAEFGDPLSQLRLSKIIGEDALNLDWLALSPLEIVQSVTDIIVRLGPSSEMSYQSLYILIDRIDEAVDGTESAANLLIPLLSERTLLEAPRLAFKFFLPIKVGNLLRQSVDLRPDRICIRTISWDRPTLAAVIHQRMAFYSDNLYKQLEDICTATAKARLMERLISASEGSPRTLLRLCQSLFLHHVERTDESLINNTDVTATLTDFVQKQAVEEIATTTPLHPEKVTEQTEPPTETDLYLDPQGHVWVEGKRIDPPLSSQESRLLHVLHQKAPGIVSKEELITAVWTEDPWDLDSEEQIQYDEQNLRKLVARLRQRLEPDISGRDSRFIKSARGRGYWLKLS